MDLIQSATSTIEFSIENIMYRKIDGMAMGSQLSHDLINIFVGYYEKLFSEISKPAVCFKYVDVPFVAFSNSKKSEEFLVRLDDLHSSL